jgi:CGNR zinc finger
MPKTKKAERVPESYSQINREANLGLQRIGRTPVDKLKWLIEFAYYTDVDKLSEGRLADLGWELVSFPFDEIPEQPTDLKVPFKLDSGAARISLDFIRSLQGPIKKGLDNFFSNKGWAIETPKVFKRLKVGTRPYIYESLKDKQPLRIRYAIGLVEAEGERLLLCRNPRCKRPFVAEKKGVTLYCSPKCSNYVRVNVHRARTELKARPDYSKLKGRALLQAWRDIVRAKLGTQNDDKAMFETLGEEITDGNQ